MWLLCQSTETYFEHGLQSVGARKQAQECCHANNPRHKRATQEAQT